MDHQSNRALQQFKNYVGIKFQLYNSLFTSLPFHRIEKTGILLSLLANNCEEGYKKKLSPVRSLKNFLTNILPTRTKRTRLIFYFVLYNMLNGRWYYLMHWKMQPFRSK